MHYSPVLSHNLPKPKWLEVIFNPSLPYRLAHMLLASVLTVAFVLAGVSALQVLDIKAVESTSRVLRTGLTLGAVLISLQIGVGDLHRLNTLEYQPQIVVAMEGIWGLLRRVRWNVQALPKPLLWSLVVMTFSGWVATVAGWYVTEIGRQPYIVFGILRTSEVASQVPSSLIALTLTLYITVYVVLIASYISVLRYMAGKPVDMGGSVPATPVKLYPQAEQPRNSQALGDAV